MAFPTNEIAGARRLLTLLQPFERVITLHGHHHENDRHFVGSMEVMTTAAVSGNWWKTGLESRGPQGREPQGYRVVEVDAEGGSGTSTTPSSRTKTRQWNCAGIRLRVAALSMCSMFAAHAGRGGGFGAVSAD